MSFVCPAYDGAWHSHLLPTLKEWEPGDWATVYSQKYDCFKHYDKLRWQVPTVVAGLSSLIAAIAGKLGDGIADQGDYLPFAFAGLSLYAFASCWLQLRITRYLNNNTWVLRKLERVRFRCAYVPRPPIFFSSAAFWFAVLSFVVASVAAWIAADLFRADGKHLWNRYIVVSLYSLISLIEVIRQQLENQILYKIDHEEQSRVQLEAKGVDEQEKPDAGLG